MKNFNKLALFIALLFLFLTSCVPEENCKFCEAVVYDNTTNTEISRSDAVEYCGDELSKKEDATPVVINNEKTVWECK
jgi:hypothetical protein